MGVQSSEWELPHHNEKFIAIIFRTLNAVWSVWTFATFINQNQEFNAHLKFENFIALWLLMEVVSLPRDYCLQLFKVTRRRRWVWCAKLKLKKIAFIECLNVKNCLQLILIVWRLPSALLNDQSHIDCI